MLTAASTRRPRVRPEGIGLRTQSAWSTFRSVSSSGTHSAVPAEGFGANRACTTWLHQGDLRASTIRGQLKILRRTPVNLSRTRKDHHLAGVDCRFMKSPLTARSGLSLCIGLPRTPQDETEAQHHRNAKHHGQRHKGQRASADIVRLPPVRCNGRAGRSEGRNGCPRRSIPGSRGP